LVLDRCQISLLSLKLKTSTAALVVYMAIKVAQKGILDVGRVWFRLSLNFDKHYSP
jgi:hypothetical protein